MNYRQLEKQLQEIKKQLQPDRKNMYAVRIPDKDSDWPEKEEDRRLNRRVVLIVRG